MQAPPPIVRYERERPGEMLHLDTKKLRRIVRPSHRVTGNRRDSVDGAGWEVLHLAIDDHSRLAYTEVLVDERRDTTTGFLARAIDWFSAHGVTIERIMTDNGSACRSRCFADALRQRGIAHRFTRPYTPRTNGKAERFVQTALREWAYAYTYRHSAERTRQLAGWQHFYNHHRRHSALDFQPPISRIPRNNLSNLNTADSCIPNRTNQTKSRKPVKECGLSRLPRPVSDLGKCAGGGSPRTRTGNLLIKSQLLYQLS